MRLIEPTTDNTVLSGRILLLDSTNWSPAAVEEIQQTDQLKSSIQFDMITLMENHPSAAA